MRSFSGCVVELTTSHIKSSCGDGSNVSIAKEDEKREEQSDGAFLWNFVCVILFSLGIPLVGSQTPQASGPAELVWADLEQAPDRRDSDMHHPVI